MLFNTITFWSIFIVFLFIYALLRRESRVGMMLYVIAFSLYFFYQANGWMMLLLPLTAVVSWFLTRWMFDLWGRKRKEVLVLTIVLDLLPLLIFKFTDFGIETFNNLLQTNFQPLDLVLPIGISFYTFQAISHAVDVYRGRFDMEVTFLEYLFYLSFFPLLLAGPITRASTLFPQMRRRGKVSQRLLYTGLFLIILGLLKKSLVADYISQYNNWIFANPIGYSGFEVLMGIIGYSLQIYLDFSGYSDMSIGIAAMMGLRLCDNFNLPYQSVNVQEFWHRWHISLSTWFRDYVYIPLGGNRKGLFRTCMNNIVTMLLAGLWHGTTLMFIIWGGIHGVALAVHKLCRKLFLDKIPDNDFTVSISWVFTWLFVVAAWVFFRSPNIGTALAIFQQVVTQFDIAFVVPFLQARPLWFAMVVAAYLFHCVSEHHYNRVLIWFVKSPWIVKLIVFIIVVQLVIQFHTSSVQPFIYYQY